MKTWTSILCSLAFILPSVSSATVTLKRVEILNGTLLHWSFDQKVDERQVKIQFTPDEIQLTLNDVVVHPAKNIPVKHGPIYQVFAFQQSPQVVKCRLRMRGNAEEFRQRVEFHAQGNQLQMRLLEAPLQALRSSSESIAPAAHQALVTSSEVDKESHVQKNEENITPQEKALEEKISQSEVSPSASIGTQVSVSQPADGVRVSKPLPSISSVLMKLFWVTLMIVVLAFMVRVLKNFKFDSESGWLKSIKNLTQGGLQNPPEGIEILGSHSIGQKKSLLTIRISGQTLLLGVTDHSIQLITQLNAQQILTSADSQGDLNFEETLNAESETGIRSRIRSRLEGLKPL